MTEKLEPLVFFLTNGVYGDSNYEQNLWEGASAETTSQNCRLCTFAGGQLSADNLGKLEIPFLFDIAAKGNADAFIINGGTIKTGLDIAEFQRFLTQFPNDRCAVTSSETPGRLNIGVDNFSGMKSMITHLATNLGARRIAYISGPHSNLESMDRLKAYKEALQEQSLAVDESLIFEGTWIAPSGSKAIQHFIQQGIKFDAVAAANDLMAIDAMEELLNRGFDIPKAIPVSGFDDSLNAVFCSPKLSTVFQPIGELARTALILLVRQLRGETIPARALVPARVVLRDSAPANRSGHATAKVTVNEGNSRGDDLVGLSNDIRQLTKAAGLSPTIQGMVESLIGAIQGNQENFGAIVAKALRAAKVPEVDLLENLMGFIQSAVTLRIHTLSTWQAVSNLNQNITQGINEFRINDSYHRSKQNEALMNSLITVNRILNEVGALQDLEGAMERGFGQCGINTCHVVLFADDHATSGQARRVASLVDGKAQSALTVGALFPTHLILEGGLQGMAGRNWLVCPLAFEEQKLGYLVYLKTDVVPFIYEALANQVASLLHSILLIEKIEKAELAAAKRAERISELVRPMIATIESSGALAREQGTTMANLVVANTETARRLSESEKHVTEMQDDLKKIIALTGTIDELSETINVIAINAAIAAARAGADGKVFGVISTEIRKLSIQTKTSTGEISSYLNELSQNSSSFFDANSQTRAVFSRLESEIKSLMASLASIQEAMSDMTGKAELVLTTMS